MASLIYLFLQLLLLFSYSRKDYSPSLFTMHCPLFLLLVLLFTGAMAAAASLNGFEVRNGASLVSTTDYDKRDNAGNFIYTCNKNGLPDIQNPSGGQFGPFNLQGWCQPKNSNDYKCSVVPLDNCLTLNTDTNIIIPKLDPNEQGGLSRNNCFNCQINSGSSNGGSTWYSTLQCQCGPNSALTPTFSLSKNACFSTMCL
ncbi:hypothetical protein F5Y16DRAFT_421556 [Xylariaceae sp. FL0255]|nr:hypothetical protein F5Y16DRAFT_421556 [Xylariaceae sp. FL0255]